VSFIKRLSSNILGLASFLSSPKAPYIIKIVRSWGTTVLEWVSTHIADSIHDSSLTHNPHCSGKIEEFMYALPHNSVHRSI